MSLGRAARSLLQSPRVPGSRLPRVIEPMLPGSAAEPFDSPAHIFEVIWDGLRAIIFVESERIRIQDRYGRDLTHRFPELQAIARRVHGSGLALDGEIVSLDRDHRPDFSRMVPRLASDDPEVISGLADGAPVTFQAFDLLHREGQPVTGWTLRRRKEMLRNLVRPSPLIAVPDWVTSEGIAFFEAAREHNLEGIVAKELDSRYLVGQRSSSWLSVKVFQKDEFVIAGYTFGGSPGLRGRGRSAREPVHSLLLGAYDADEGFHFVGEVNGGFSPGQASALAGNLDSLASNESPYTQAPTVNRLVFWCRPEICATVRFGGWAPDRTLRFPVFEAARPDVPALTCRLPEDS